MGYIVRNICSALIEICKCYQYIQSIFDKGLDKASLLTIKLSIVNILPLPMQYKVTEDDVEILSKVTFKIHV